MIPRGISRRYAKALFEVDKKYKTHERTYNDLTAITDLISRYKEIFEFLKNPFFNKRIRKETFAQIASILNLSTLVRNFINLLIDDNRVGYLPEITDIYARLFDESRGILRATLISPVELEASQIERIKEGLEKRFNKRIKLDVYEDPSVVGGVVVKVGNIIIDGSIKSQLIHMKEELTRG